jgi:hypothetical protein
VKFYAVDSRADHITGISVNELKFEEEVYSSTGLNQKVLIERII